MHIPRKRFGQHFLHDNAVISRIVEALHPALSDHLVEIGPGQGALTLPVLRLVSVLDAIELDRDLIVTLLKRSKQIGEIRIHQGDVLQFNFATLKTDARLLRVFGNLPYNISTPLIFHLLTYANIISDMIFMLQKEMAERLAANVDTGHYGRLSVMVQYHCQADCLFDIAPHAFMPPPKVDSSIISLVPYRCLPYQADNETLFSMLVKQAFSMRRKTLRNCLKGLIKPDQWEVLSIDPNRRAETVSVSEFVMMSNLLNSMQSSYVQTK